MGKEIELKYVLPDRVHAQDLLAWAPLAARIRDKYDYEMETVYYDTPELALSQRRWTLRRRRENGRGVICMKTAALDHVRGEWELPGEDVAAALPGLVASGAPKELADLAEGGLGPLCGARFHRTARLLALEDGTCELALDQGVLLAGAREQPFRELELELKSGSPSGMLRLGGELAAAFDLSAQEASKFLRAKALLSEE